MMDKNTLKLDVEYIATLNSLLSHSGLTELRLENGLTSIYLKREQSGQFVTEESVSADLTMPVYEQDNTRKTPEDRDSVVSPTVGIVHFFKSELGFPRQVEVNELLATIHVGLLQLPVRSVKDSSIGLADVQDSQVVEYGTELFQYHSNS